MKRKSIRTAILTFAFTAMLPLSSGLYANTDGDATVPEDPRDLGTLTCTLSVSTGVMECVTKKPEKPKDKN